MLFKLIWFGHRAGVLMQHSPVGHIHSHFAQAGLCSDSFHCLISIIYKVDCGILFLDHRLIQDLPETNRMYKQSRNLETPYYRQMIQHTGTLPCVQRIFQMYSSICSHRHANLCGATQHSTAQHSTAQHSTACNRSMVGRHLLQCFYLLLVGWKHLTVQPGCVIWPLHVKQCINEFQGPVLGARCDHIPRVFAVFKRFL